MTKVDETLSRIEDFYGVNLKERKYNNKTLNLAKTVAIYILYNHFCMTLHGIKEKFGYKDHTSVLYYLNQVIDHHTFKQYTKLFTQTHENEAA